jgi:hypothetical protein
MDDDEVVEEDLMSISKFMAPVVCVRHYSEANAGGVGTVRRDGGVGKGVVPSLFH